MIAANDYIAARDAVHRYDRRPSARLLLDVCHTIYLLPALEDRDDAEQITHSAIAEFCEKYDGVTPPDRYLVAVFKKWAHRVTLQENEKTPATTYSNLLPMDTIE